MLEINSFHAARYPRAPEKGFDFHPLSFILRALEVDPDGSLSWSGQNA
jgi:hypothetical protein